MHNLSETIRTVFPTKKVLIVGDLVADQFLHGTIARVSREAPVLILSHDGTDTRAGGAANTAVNVASLGAKPILIGLTGQDPNGELLAETLQCSNVDRRLIVTSPEIQTTTKVRVLAGQHYAPRQQVIRIDYENRSAIAAETRERLMQNLSEAGSAAEAIVVSDYNYGTADLNVAARARRISKERNIPLLIDSRFRLAEFPDATGATPNQEEVEQILGKDFTPGDCERLRKELRYRSLLVTRGNKGMILFEEGRPHLDLAPVGSSEPVDVTGAGDTVMAVYALGLASRLSFRDAARAANHAGGIVVMKKGTASVSQGELLASIAREIDAPATQSAESG